MDTARIALANLRFPATPEESISLAEQAIFQASLERASVIFLPECYVPGYRAKTKQVSPPDQKFLECAWSTIAIASAKTAITAILGTERIVDDRLLAGVMVFNPDGSTAGIQDKVQIDPSEEAIYSFGSGEEYFKPDL